MAGLRPRRWTTSSGHDRRGYEVSWYDEHGKQRTKLFSGVGARAQARRFSADLDSAPLRQKSPSISIADAGERWWTNVRRAGREWSTWENYRQHVEDHLGPLEFSRVDGSTAQLGALPITELTAPDCDAVKNVLLGKLSATLAAKVMKSLRMLLNHSVRAGLIPANPAQAVRIVHVDRGEEFAVIPPEKDIRTIVRAVRTKPPAAPNFTEVWVRTILATGLRPSEARGLAIEDLTLQGASPGIAVQRRADNRGKIGALKSKSGRRFVPIGPSLVRLLRRWLLVVPRGDGIEDPVHRGRKLALLFPTSIGTIQSYHNIYNRVWAPLLYDLGMAEEVPLVDAAGDPRCDEDGTPLVRLDPRYPLNVLRHIAASLMIAEGADPKMVQVRMGHSSIQTTFNLYGHLFARRQQDNALAAKIERGLLR